MGGGEKIAVPEQGHRSVSWQRRSLRWHFRCGSRGTRGQDRGRRRGGTSPVPPEYSAGLHVGEEGRERTGGGREQGEGENRRRERRWRRGRKWHKSPVSRCLSSILLDYNSKYIVQETTLCTMVPMMNCPPSPICQARRLASYSHGVFLTAKCV